MTRKSYKYLYEVEVQINKILQSKVEALSLSSNAHFARWAAEKEVEKYKALFLQQRQDWQELMATIDRDLSQARAKGFLG